MVPRTVDAGSSNRRLRTYNPFGCKIFAGENHPDSKYLGGFNDRTFRAEVKKGKPILLIKKILRLLVLLLVTNKTVSGDKGTYF